MKATINDLYTYSLANSLPLLGSNNFDFWDDYLDNYTVYDRYFRDSFMRWFYWIDFEDDEAIANIHTDFVGGVQAFLMLNKKRYAEIYRVQALAENAYDIVNNYDLSESITRTNTGTVENASGVQSNSYTKGAQTNTDQYGASSRTIAEGAQENSHSDTKGTYTDSHTHSTSPFDSSEFNNESQDVDIMGAHSDSSTDNIGAKSTTESSLAKTDTHSSQSYTDSETLGAKTDTRTDDLTETITTTKSGNIGVQTAAEIIGGHIDLWNRFNFYKMIFDEVAKEYLVIDDDYSISSGTYSSQSTNAILTAIQNLSNKLDDVEQSINDNVDAAEANIRGDIVEVSTNGY